MNDPGDSGLHTFLSTLGGEDLNKNVISRPMRLGLRALGTPSVVVVSIDLSRPRREVGCYWDLRKVFVGTDLGLHDSGADIFYGRDIPADQVERVLQPGNPEYNLFAGLPLK